jgi:hypothetical protein
VFVYSGHGTTFTRRDAADNLDEAKDQALCLAGPLDPASFLVDDELAGLFAGVPQGVNLTVICDSCFSGGMEKGLLPLPGEGRSVKYLPLPVDLAHRDDPFAPVRSFGCGQPSKAAAQPAPCLLLAACREIEPAAAARPETRGLSVFSYFAIRTLRSSTASYTATDLVSSVAQQIYNCGYPQVPQLKGPAAACQQPLFS